MRREGWERKDRVPPVVAAKGVPFACEREMGGTGEGVKRWATQEERRRM